MKRALLGALLVTGCASTREPKATLDECVTACGLRAPGGNCEEIQEAEARIVHSFGRFIANLSEAQACAALAGWRVFLHVEQPADVVCGSDSWHIKLSDARWMCARGFAHVERREIEVMDTDWLENALAHELVHAIDWTTLGTVGHCKWEERGVKRALHEVTGYADPTKPDCD